MEEKNVKGTETKFVNISLIGQVLFLKNAPYRITGIKDQYTVTLEKLSYFKMLFYISMIILAEILNIAKKAMFCLKYRGYSEL